VASDPTKDTDDVSGVARAVEDETEIESDGQSDDPEGPEADAQTQAASGVDATPGASDPPPPAVAELAAACVRFVAQRYGAALDFAPDTLSLLDQWLRDARVEVEVRPEAAGVVEAAGGAYLGEVVRRHFGGRWFSDGDVSAWRLYLTTVYCAFNPIGMAREALLLGAAEGWHAHFELDPAQREGIDARLAALPDASDDEYYAPSTRFDVLWIVFDALRDDLRSRGLDDVRFDPQDYD
jgi:hypothetical protein